MRALLLAAVACAASLPGAGAAAEAAAPWTLTRGSLVVEEVPTGNAWQTRSYLLSDLASKEAALVDCGGNASGAFAAAARQGVTIVALLQTHAHVDHVFGLADARAAAPDAPLHLHAGDAALYAAYGVPLPRPMQAAAARAFPLAARLAAAAGVGELRLPVVDVWLKDGDELQVGSARLRVRHTPGHTPGHVTFYEPKARLLFGGDLIIGSSVGRADLPGGDEQLVARSAAETCARLPPDAMVLSGHAPAVTVAWLRQNNAWCRPRAAHAEL